MAIAVNPQRETPGRLNPLGWLGDPELPYREWIVEGRRIGLILRGSPWWIGDWLLYGTQRWGEMYSQAARVTGYDRKSLRNMRYVSSRFELSLRRDDLTWSHHALLASFEPEEQQRWLEQAATQRLSVEDLRVELRALRCGTPAHEHEPAQRGALGRDRTVLCPRCGEAVPIPVGSAALGA